jgi:hypothetical protein
MEPTPTQPTHGASGSANSPYIGSPATSSSTGDSQFSTTAAHATGTGNYPTDYTTPNSQPTTGGVQGTLNNALASGKKWLNDSGISDKAQQLPQAAKELGNKAVSSVNSLTTTQKAAGVGLLAAGVAFLLTRGGKKKKHKKDDGDYRHKAHRSPFEHQPHTKDGDYAYDRKGQRPWGTSRYGSAAGQGQGQNQGNRSRINSGSGYSSATSHTNDFGSQSGNHNPSTGNRSYAYGSDAQSASGQRRDQGPNSGSQYDAKTSGGQNPNNLDQLNSAY